MYFLQAKTAVTTFIRDFNQPFEKQLLRVSKNPREAYCLTRRGVRRFLLTKRVRALPAYADWLEHVLLPLMRPGNENLPVPREAQRGGGKGDRAIVGAGGAGGAGNAGGGGKNDPAGGAPSALSSAGDSASAAAARSALLQRAAGMPLPSASVLSAWLSSSITTLEKAIAEDDAAIASSVAIAAASASVKHTGASAAGRSWQGGADAGGKFDGKVTRVGDRFQAVIPDRMERRELSAGGRWDG